MSVYVCRYVYDWVQIFVCVCVLVESGVLHSLYYTVMTLSDVSYNEDLCACMYVRVHVCFCFVCVCATFIGRQWEMTQSSLSGCLCVKRKRRQQKEETKETTG